MHSHVQLRTIVHITGYVPIVALTESEIGLCRRLPVKKHPEIYYFNKGTCFIFDFSI